ncbi:MAG TPA: site-2 protease family protein [Tepidisphaeraceae bacterium]|nr:site-2 protease family protein [Tepidisphaeraceae bacterium]
MLFLGRIDFNDPAFWAVLIGWVMAVTLHELAHGVVAFWGGDYTIRERGGLTLNPLQYVDPFNSILIPVIFLAIGGIALPGGATFVRRDLLRSRGWDTAVSAAGPAMNLILFGLLAIPLLPAAGWIDINDPLNWTTAQRFVAASCFLQLFSVILNLIPIPPLDGFGMIAPYLQPELRDKLSTPPVSTALFFGYFMLILLTPFIYVVFAIMHAIMGERLFDISSYGWRSVLRGG